MRVLQLDDYQLFVTVCYSHAPPPTPEWNTCRVAESPSACGLAGPRTRTGRVLCGWVALAPGHYRPAEALPPVSCAAAEASRGPCGSRSFHQGPGAQNVRYRAYGARHGRTTAPLQPHHHHGARRWPASRPRQFRGGSRSGGLAPVRQHRQRVHGRPDHHRGHRPCAQQVRGRSRRPGRHIGSTPAPAPRIQPARRRSTRPCGGSTDVSCLSWSWPASTRSHGRSDSVLMALATVAARLRMTACKAGFTWHNCRSGVQASPGPRRS